ncbi:hypothetical protein N4G69_36340 [Streptomyces mirabilis]|uniref:hypothetical protein n=1 Tax=Streptomyces mirabilis TaxID=68239 RepID=UPI0021C22B82|nr:hypothetical protein [Streptomyces mirabilis]MCT9111003.1 hypothetical protein [Streptomyces mirabilis]
MPNRRRVAPPVLLFTAVALLASGCFLGPSDPADTTLVGARVEGETIVVKIPLCPSDELRRVEVTDWDKAEDTNPPIVWWASGPRTASAKRGVVRLWSAEGFDRHAATPAPVPRTLDVAYLDPSGEGRDYVVGLPAVAAAKLKPGQYWTDDGPRTAAQIDARLDCHTVA